MRKLRMIASWTYNVGRCRSAPHDSAGLASSLDLNAFCERLLNRAPIQSNGDSSREVQREVRISRQMMRGVDDDGERGASATEV